MQGEEEVHVTDEDEEEVLWIEEDDGSSSQVILLACGDLTAEKTVEADLANTA